MKLIDKSVLVAEIKKLKYIIMPYPTMAEKVAYRDGIEDAIKIVIKFLEVKEVDLNKEIESYFKGFGKFASVGIDDCIDIAKHFFELGLKVQYSSINNPNIDDLLEEDGINPYSKDAKLFKECYYTALERYKEKKGMV